MRGHACIENITNQVEAPKDKKKGILREISPALGGSESYHISQGLLAFRGVVVATASRGFARVLAGPASLAAAFPAHTFTSICL